MNSDPFPLVKIGTLLERVNNPVDVDGTTLYQQIGIRSHGKGLFNKPPILGTELGEKRVFWIEPDCFIVNIVFAWEQAVGRTTQADRGKIASHRFPMFRPKAGKSDVDFISYLFKTHHGKELLALASPGGAGRNKTLGQNEFLKIKVRAPSFPEQKRIAEILSTWDTAIGVQERLIANARTQKKALMQTLLTGKKRLPGFEGDWKTVTLGACTKSHDNRRVPLSSDQRAGIHGEIPYYGANGIVGYVNNYLFDETVVLLAEDGGYFDEYATRPIAQLVRGKSWVNNHAHVITNKPNASIDWIYYSLVHRNILEFINGGTRAKLNKSDMLKIPMPLPELAEQRAICVLFEGIDKLILHHIQNKNIARLEKSALMQQLLTGKRRVKLSNEEPSLCPS